MKKIITYILSIFILFLVVCWVFNHVSAWGSIFLAIAVIVVWLLCKEKKIKQWFDDITDVY